MFEILYRRKADVVQHRAAPFVAERERYLRHCAEQGGTWGRLRTTAKWLFWAAVR
jgi:integrase/recombinase XerD